MRCWANLDLLFFVFKISHVFLQSNIEWSTCLYGVRHLAVGAGKLVHSAFIIHILGLMFHGEVLTNWVVRGKRDRYVCVFE